MRGFVICFVIYFEPYCVQISPFQPSFTDISLCQPFLRVGRKFAKEISFLQLNRVLAKPYFTYYV